MKNNLVPTYKIPFTFVEYFQDDQGEVDIDKVIATTNQFMKTASQIAPMVKTLNDFVKGMKL
ncbi:YppG family protein [Piscibacillus salipiscarius]|uniref:YppG family protein n=1 Tax=Piscibacillus salipiscarius TaxID=299480 RepID=UPI0024364112|nr:YppG family protein [Piscibacillus salipiscarius]